MGTTTTGLRVVVLGMNYAPEPTGIAPYTTAMCRGLSDRGHEVRVLTAFPHYPQWQLAPSDRAAWSRREAVEGIPTVRLRHYVPEPPRGVRRAASEATFGLRLMAAPWGRADVVVCLSPALLSTALAMSKAALLRRRPALGVVMQDLYSAGVGETGTGGSAVQAVFGRIESAVARGADGVVAIHDRFKRRIVEDLGAPPGRVTVIRNWSHVSAVEPFDVGHFRATLGWGDKETVVLHAGAMGEKQALSSVVDAARLCDQRGLPIRFVLLGDGGQRRELERRASGLQSVEFRSPLPGAAFGRALRAADVLLVNEKPGLNEMAVPSKLTSYFSSGTAVLAATDSASITAEEVTTAGAGVTVKPGDPEALVSGVLSLRDDPAWLNALGSRGPDYCDKVLSEDAALDAYDAWVRELYERRHGG